MTQSALEDRDWHLLASPWHLEEQIDAFPVPDGATVIAGPPDLEASELERLAGRYRSVAGAMANVDRPLLLAGDCLTSLGVIAGLQRRHHDISVVWLDAHGDFNTPQISTSGYLAGMSLAMLTGRAPEAISDRIGLRPVPDDRALLIDARDLDPAEREALDASGVRRSAADPAAVRDALDQAATGDFYLHIDVDVIDGTDVAGLRWETSAGPSLSVVEECLAEVVRAAPPVAACIACPWTPERIGDEATRHALMRLATAIGAELEWSTAAEPVP